MAKSHWEVTTGNKPNCVRVMWQNFFPCSTSFRGDGCSWESGWSIHLQFYSVGSWDSGSQLPSAFFVVADTLVFHVLSKIRRKRDSKKKKPAEMQSTRQPAATVWQKIPWEFITTESGESHGIRVEFHRGNFEKDLKGYSQILTVIGRTICLREGIILHKQKKNSLFECDEMVALLSIFQPNSLVRVVCSLLRLWSS